MGKPLGNGYPMGAVVCSKAISDRLGGYFSTFGGNPVSCSMGLAVLDVIFNEKLIMSARSVGRIFSQLVHGIKVSCESKRKVVLHFCGLL